MTIKFLNLEITLIFRVVTINKKFEREVARYKKHVKELEQWHKDFDWKVRFYQKKGFTVDLAYVRARTAADNPLFLDFHHY